MLNNTKDGNIKDNNIVGAAIFCFIFAIPIMIILKLVISSTISILLKIYNNIFRRQEHTVEGIKEQIEFIQIVSIPENIKIIESSSCSICLEDLIIEENTCIENILSNNNMCLFFCGHYYHKNCIDKWIDHNSVLNCPLCNTSIQNIYIFNRSHNQDELNKFIEIKLN